jgi:hypothetical protein
MLLVTKGRGRVTKGCERQREADLVLGAMVSRDYRAQQRSSAAAQFPIQVIALD